MSQHGKLGLTLKPIVERAVGCLKIVILVGVVSSLGIFMGEKSLVQKRYLEQKRLLLRTENEFLANEIKSLERELTLLRSDPKTIEKAAKRKLGMARPEETVYIFEKDHAMKKRGSYSGFYLRNRHNRP